MLAPLIIGGGPAGAAAAATFAGAGQAVTLLERTLAPADKVCGDFLSGETIAALRLLGCDAAALGAQPIHRIRLCHGNVIAVADLPFAAAGLSRRTLDAALLRLAEVRGATVLRGAIVRHLDIAAGEMRVQADSVGTIATNSVIVATGKHDLRGHGRSGRDAGSVGLKMYLRLSPAQQAELCGHVELVLFPGGYAGLLAVEDGRAVLCATLDAGRFAAIGGTWMRLHDSLIRESRHLADRLRDAAPLLDRPLAVARVPYGYLHRPSAADPAGLFRVGDQAATIPSLTGDGVAIALFSGTLAARTWLRQGTARDYHRQLRDRLLWQMRLASALQFGCTAGMGQSHLIRACQRWPGLICLAANRTRLRAAQPV